MWRESGRPTTWSTKNVKTRRERERKKYFQNLETKVCVILFLKSLLMRASVRPFCSVVVNLY